MEHFDESQISTNNLDPADPRLADAHDDWERGVVAASVYAGFNHMEGLSMYREFLSTCPHPEAAIGYVQDFLTRYMAERRRT